MTEHDASRKTTAAGRWLLAGALAISFAMLALSWNLPLLEAFSYRQTQTAMSAYWLASSSSWLAYQTPMFGYPWAIPFEFPLYQVIVHGVASVLPISLDQGGRLVSWLFALATLLPLRACVKEITGREALADDLVLFFLISPLYLFGARSFLIESTALFFSVLFMAAAVRCWRAPAWPWFALMLASACAAALVKITTFFPFGVMAFLFMAWKTLGNRGARTARGIASHHVPLALAVAGALLATMLYVRYADALKLATVRGDSLTSAALATWNYGTWAQRANGHLWWDVVLGRAANDLLGSVWVAPIAILLLGLFGRGVRGIAICLAAGYVLPFLVFTNLHEVHRYYQQANGVFLLAIVACAIEALRSRFGQAVALATTVLVVVVMLVDFGRDYLPFIVSPHISRRTVALATFTRQQTRPDEVLLMFGEETSPEVAYYATRRAMIVNEKIAPAALQRMREQPSSYTGPAAVGVVIVCPNAMGKNPALANEYWRLLTAVTAGRERSSIAGCEVYR